ncbi:hypothetical protein FISHEDRAFT_20292, partial [Fistulina hepatica ATCC 64428]
IHARHGSVRLYLPHTFHGFVTTKSTSGTAPFRGTLADQMTMLVDVGNVRTSFVGDYSQYTGVQDGWHGDELEITSEHGSITVSFEQD